jgi:hypothetical protein
MASARPEAARERATANDTALASAEARASRSSLARRVAAIVGVALVAYLIVASAMVYVFGIRQLGYSFFAISDIPLYFRYASFIAMGGRPYVDFPLEYPPLAVSLFTLAGPPTHINPFASRFALQMLLFGAATSATISAAAARIWRTGRRPYLVAAGFALAVAATGALLANRFDVVVALDVAAALLLAVLGVHWAAAAVLGLGFALKLVPAILLPIVLLLSPTPRQAIRSGFAFAVGALVPFVPYLPEGLTGLGRVFAYHGVRPLQIESVLATPHWIGQLLGLVQIRIEDAFGGQNVGAPGADTIARWSGLLGVAALGATYAAAWRARARIRSDGASLALAATATILAFITFGKVLSPQFLIWLLPGVALLLPFRPWLAGTLLAAMVLTQIEFPANYFKFCAFEPAAVLCVVVRNLALLAAFGLAQRDLWRIRQEPQG